MHPLRTTGAAVALTRLGVLKTAGVREAVRKALQGPYGDLLVRTPVQAALGGVAGGISGELYGGRPTSGALLGALSGGLGGIAVAGAPKLRGQLIRSLKA